MISRREFAREVMMLAAAMAVANAPVIAAEGGGTPQSSQAEIDARVQWIITKYGSRLDNQERADVRRIIAGGQAGVEAMRKYDLENSTAPAEPFRIYRRVAKQ